MTRELVEKAEAVLGLLDDNCCETLRGARIGEWIKATDELRAALRATVIKVGAPTIAWDDVAWCIWNSMELLRIEGKFDYTHAIKEIMRLLERDVMPKVRAAEAAPVADTVAVPVAMLRRWLNDSYVIPGMRNRVAVSMDEITKILPPPPAPEPSVPGDVIDQWNREAVDYANEQFPEPPEVNRAARYGYVAARRAEWVRTQKGGG